MKAEEVPMIPLLLALACDANDTATDTAACEGAALESEGMDLDCADLASGVEVSGLSGMAVWSATVEARRVGDVLSAECEGVARVEVWRVGGPVEGEASLRTIGECAHGYSGEHTCPASGLLPLTLDPDAVIMAEVFGVVYPVPSGCGPSLVSCPPGAPVRVVQLWASLDDVGGVCP